jgi:outer membrane receptor protein involved in Fe transport
VKVGIAFLILAASVPVEAQRDTVTATALDPVVVTAERTRTAMSRTAAAITRLSGEDLRRSPEPTLAGVLRTIPGFVVIDFDGLGGDPQLMTRGFYGGGEAEYVVVLVDGRPVNQVHTGRVAWDALPRAEAIAAVEVLHGAASPAWGDAAIGGVINIMTRTTESSKVLWSAIGGSYGALQASVDASRGRTIRGSLSAERSSGFRDHSRRGATGARVGLTLADGPRGSLSLGLTTQWRRFDEPGALLDELLEQDRSASDALFRFDATRDFTTAVTADGEWRLGGSARVRTALSGEWRDLEATRTLALAPGFGDTRDRHVGTVDGRFTVQIEKHDPRGRARLPWVRRSCAADSIPGTTRSSPAHVMSTRPPQGAGARSPHEGTRRALPGQCLPTTGCRWRRRSASPSAHVATGCATTSSRNSRQAYPKRLRHTPRSARESA